MIFFSNFIFNSLRDAIAKKPENWADCAMWVEDILSPEVNITAEISNEDADNFVKLCQMFSAHVPKLDEISPPNASIRGTVDLNQRTEIFRLIEVKIAAMSHPMFLEPRRQSEAEITSTLRKYIHGFDASLETHVFGSSRYCIKASDTNFNLLVNTRMFVR